MAQTIDFFGCAAHSDVFSVRSHDPVIDIEMETTHCSKKSQNNQLYTSVCNNGTCSLSFIGTRSYDSYGVLCIDTVTQQKLEYYDFSVRWLPNVTMLTSDGKLVEE